MTAKTTQVMVRIEPEHKAAIEARAEQVNLRPASWIRQVLLDALQRLDALERQTKKK